MIIEAHGLTRTFVRHRLRGQHIVTTAVDDLDLAVEPGESVGYIGANGAGKSTTIKMLMGILVPTSGTVRTVGVDPIGRRRHVAQRVGAVFGQRSQLWWDLSVLRSLKILAAIHRIPDGDAARRSDRLGERLELTGFWDRPVRQLSLGERMRAEVAAALLHSPELLILDEPTIGLDVVSKQRLREFLISERAERGLTLLLTTHDMGDVERLCERILVVDHGRKVFDGTAAGLAATVGAGRVLVVDLDRPMQDLTSLPGARHLESEAGGLRQRFALDGDVPDALAALTAQVGLRDIAIEEPDIEDVVRRLYARSR
ncbi:ATP-binding cassette domain-containing protein [Tsukamurella sp. 8F]|uniref:ABC transporter ATP-binding protein n=1 Tax=unclassified Tsukamurella TaxID=2633480 RepID=UPI0023B8E8E0|nr:MULTISPECIES: ATP-binding cassette domain-containing protein [unclassified Tsukamurella]MDF0529599.1 ATP-binding cassette domain-containing protein [Tsukamurella sp. 8J]MDF0585713.1 ATP-binding cassette domain-containing protein [Tsukamurella sp. 8F]